VEAPAESVLSSQESAIASSRGNTPQRLLNAGLLLIFLALTFLLGVFPLKDADIYWHLRTGQLIRQTGVIPRTDIFTYTREGAPWIDLHWIFQIGSSWLHDHYGAPGLNLAKCLITTLAMLILVLSGRSQWPFWITILAWLPALFVLSGRMYVRPETLTLLYLAVFLAVLANWDRHPRLVWILPLVQTAWVNSQGLFILGPIVFGFALIEAVLTRGFLSEAARSRRKTIALAGVLVLAACLINPYGIAGALYPLELAQTMANPIFARSIAELTPIPEFIHRAGWNNLPLQIHLSAMALGGLSFLIPALWKIGEAWRDWSSGVRATPVRQLASQVAARKERSVKGPSRARRKQRRGHPCAATGVERALGWQLSIFRLLLFAAFSALSLRATRNTHQFAAVVGAVTAWNFASWGAAVRARRILQGRDLGTSPSPTLLVAGLIAGLILFVSLGTFYRLTGEGRTVALGEEPLFFPHAAARFAGKPDLPDRFLSFHNGHASLYEYYNGPARKVYTDPRLEVAGAELFQKYMHLESQIAYNQPGWPEELDRIGRPIIMVDHEHNSSLGATILSHDEWRCVWFDPSVALFVHRSYRQAVARHTVDFGRRHFDHELESDRLAPAEIQALAKALGAYVMALGGQRPELARPIVWLGQDAVRRLMLLYPNTPLAWKVLAQLELFRENLGKPAPRYRMPYNPVHDLALFRATYALQKTLASAPEDFLSLVLLRAAYEARQMNEQARQTVERLIRLAPINLAQQQQIAQARQVLESWHPTPPVDPAAMNWRNLSELDQKLSSLLEAGQVEPALELVESALADEGGPWALADTAATLRLHLGDPVRARWHWERAGEPPRPGLRQARIGLANLIAAQTQQAREQLTQAIKINPELFEAHYLLAVLEQDSGNALPALEAAQNALKQAADEVDRLAARVLAAGLAPYVRAAQERPPANPEAGSAGNFPSCRDHPDLTAQTARAGPASRATSANPPAATSALPESRRRAPRPNSTASSRRCDDRAADPWAKICHETS